LNNNLIELSAEAGNCDVVEELIRRGSLVNAVTDHGFTPLHLAAKSGSLPTVKLLCKNGANLDARTRTERNSALHIAVKEGQQAIIKFLLDLKVNPDPKNVLGIVCI